MRKLLQCLVGVVWLSASGYVSASAMLMVNPGGELEGAWGVQVDGRLLDVTFVDGTCMEVFDGCDDNSDFFFADDPLGALAASQALLAMVFVNDPLGDFDDQPELTAGCDSLTTCIAFTPFRAIPGPQVQSWGAANGSASNAILGPGLDSTTSPLGSGGVWAVWSESVPAPSTLLLTGLGLGLVGATRRRKRKGASV